MLNPPYGRRLRAKSEIGPFYQQIAAKLKSEFNGWRTALIVPPSVHLHKLKLKLKLNHRRSGKLARYVRELNGSLEVA